MSKHHDARALGRRFARLIPTGGDVLDLAARPPARYLAASGMRSRRSRRREALAKPCGRSRRAHACRRLERGPWRTWTEFAGIASPIT